MATQNDFPPSEEEIRSIVDVIEYDLMTKPKIEFTLDKKWSANFPNQPGVYAVFENGNFVYIGETSDIQARMKDVRRIYNHSFRNKLGKLRLKGTRQGSKFSSEIETALDEYMVKHLKFTAHALTLGRKEVEARIIEKYKEQLLNSVSIRGSKK